MKSTVENKIVLNDNIYTYIVEYKRIKNIYFRVKDDLKIHVSAPKSVTKNYIESLLKANEDAIIKMYSRINSRAVNNSKLCFLGNELVFRKYDGMPYISEDYIYAKDENSAKEYIYSLAFNVFSERVDRIKNSFNNLPDFRLKVRKMSSKWGVCNIRSMTVTLNLELIFKDVHLIDYVIVHELCHFAHMNHSKEFWKEVAKHYPYYKEARKELNE